MRFNLSKFEYFQFSKNFTQLWAKFFEKADAFALYPTVDGKYYTYEELFNKIKAKQTDKDDKLVILYASNKDEQHSYIEAAKAKGYEVLLLDSPIVSHLIQKLETTKEN